MLECNGGVEGWAGGFEAGAGWVSGRKNGWACWIRSAGPLGELNRPFFGGDLGLIVIGFVGVCQWAKFCGWGSGFGPKNSSRFLDCK